jgi:hypothetical protein
MWDEAYSWRLDARGPQCKVGLCRGLGGEGIGWYYRLSDSRGITNIYSNCDTASHRVRSCCSVSLQFAAVHQPYDPCKESPSVCQIYRRFSTTLHGIGIGIGIGIDIGVDKGNCLIGYLDSAWANYSADYKSQRGLVFLASNGAISWQSREQRFLAMSTLKAEFIACLEASSDAGRLLQLQRDIHSSKKDSPPLSIHRDYQGAVNRITTEVIKARTKHIEVSNDNSRDLYKRQIVNYCYVHTNENVADILTKASVKDMHEQFTKAIGRW